MKLFLVFIILLFEVPTGGARPKNCFNDIPGYCRKKCKLGEIYEVGCLNGKLCCVNGDKNKRQVEVQQPDKTYNKNSSEFMDYIVLPTITILTDQH
ncbi:beta-defensin 128 [Carlito syrichta]|uniref:Beta-defensin n=1 Tax=Carlito syrichta TaxID=1868482 RepID=A0A3Q0DZR9_CARSF|nr:beta-defensin 128 [Carlito syrichta]